MLTPGVPCAASRQPRPRHHDRAVSGLGETGRPPGSPADRSTPAIGAHPPAVNEQHRRTGGAAGQPFGVSDGPSGSRERAKRRHDMTETMAAASSTGRVNIAWWLPGELAVVGFVSRSADARYNSCGTARSSCRKM